MGNWDSLDMQAKLRPGFVPDACVAQVLWQPLGPMQEFDAEAIAAFCFIIGFSISNQSSQSLGKEVSRMLGSPLPLF